MSCLSVTILTLFPQMFPGPLGFSLVGAALKKKIWDLTVIDLKDFAMDAHGTVDKPTFGGGPGMVLCPDVVHRAVQAVRRDVGPQARLIYLSPRGQVWSQQCCVQWAQEKRPLILLCGRFEGVDQRVLEFWDFEEISLGDFVLAGGEIPAMALIEGCVRLLEGVVGDKLSLAEESFSNYLLEYPHYTRPRFWNDISVPSVLLSGHHERIRQWRLERAQDVTQTRRPDLWAVYQKQAMTLKKEKKK